MATPPRRRSRTHTNRTAQPPQHRRRAFVAVERLWGRLADLLGAGPTKATTPTFTLAPRRLEPRRMLDAAGAAMALETVAVSTAFTPTSEDAAATPPVANLNGNTAPSDIEIQTPIIIDENGVATLALTFTDPDLLDTHTIEINWQDGSTESFSLAAGATSFATTHQYLDDNLSGPATEDYDVTIRVTDSAGEFAEETSKITVLNVAPSNLQIATIAPINENGVATLNLSFDDPGTVDEHTVEVDWGDGSAAEVFTVPTGDRTFSATHQYFDDNPTGTASDEYAISVRLADDDLGETTAAAIATVNNVAPSNVQVTPVANILDEGGAVALTVKFDDPGSQDTHQVEINWGDGNVTTTTAVGHTLNANHTYGDNATYAIIVKVIDDDGGVGFGSAAALVKNVPPANVQIDPIAPIDENGVAVLKLTFDDPGTLDSHTVEVDWGDGTVETIAVAAGSRTFTANHQYLDDNPTGTTADNYTVNVKVRDDDGGEATGSATAQVLNVPPTNVVVTPVATITAAGTQINLGIAFDDAGSQDTHQVEINWGDGNVTTATAVGHALNANHTYGDNATYAVIVKVIDDDGGAGFGSAAVFVSNVAPSNVQIDPIAAIDENGVASLNLTFDDPGTLDSHTVEVNWGDGTIDTLAVVAGARTFTATHRYLDDNPTGTSSDVYTVNVTVRDDDGGQAIASQTVTVSNVAPANVQIAPIVSIDENGVATLNLTFDDPGTLDSHTVEINWGDGNVETFAVAAGARMLTATHHYLDDNPTATLSDVYTVNVTVRDDDGGVAAATATVTVNNVPPVNVVATPSASEINEGSGITLNVTFDDVGSQDTHACVINWGDGHETVGSATGHAFEANHVYADNGTYAITVTVTDDDGGSGVGNTSIVVHNVAPSLDLSNADLTVNEGDAINLAGLGVIATDPGFKNSLGGTDETFVQGTVDWGDGTAAIPLTVAVSEVGGVGKLTKGAFSHADHYYADNGTYTVTVKFTDDDGGVASHQFTIVVENVAPTLTLTDRPLPEIVEGGLLDVSDLATFFDPGFDNPNNPNGASEEFFDYVIEWGDGCETTGRAPISTFGSPGVKTEGSFGATHVYADNDSDGTYDNIYTIKVTLIDDDGGKVTKTIQVTVINVRPEIVSMSATDINSKGETTLTIVFEDPGKDDFTVEVDWGDGKGFVSIDVPAAQRDQRVFVYTHKYTEPPNNSAADIILKARVLDDDAGEAGVRDNRPSEEERDTISQPGLGAEKFRIDTTPQVAILTFPNRQVVPLLPTAADARLVTVSTSDDGGGGGDTRATSERYLELRVINPDGKEGPGYRLPAKVLNNLPALFRNLPDNHYKIFLVQSETNARRLVIEVFVRNGKLIDPGDDSEGARDRPPTEEATTRPVEEQPAAAPAGEEAPPVELPVEPQASFDGRHRPRSSSAIYHSATLAGVAIALSGAGKNSLHKLEEAIARAKPDQWKRLRSAGTPRPKKPR